MNKIGILFKNLKFLITMKKYKFALIAIMITCNAQAQFTLAYRADFVLTGIYKDARFLPNTKVKSDFQLGIMGDLILNSTLSIYMGILYAPQGYKIEYSNSHVNISTTTSLNYIRLPLNIQHKYTLNNNEKFKLLYYAGPYIGYGFGGKVKGVSITNGSENGEPYIIKNVIDKKINMGSGDDKDFKSLDFGIGVAIGVQYTNIQSRLGFYYGLIDISNSSNLKSDDPNIAILEELTSGKIKNRGIALYSVTIKFGKHKNQ